MDILQCIEYWIAKLVAKAAHEMLCFIRAPGSQAQMMEC